MRGPLLQSAALAAALLAADVAVLTLFLNPEATLRRDGLALLLCLFLPYLLGGTLAFLALAAGGRWLLGSPEDERGRVLPAHPWFVSLAFLALCLAALLFWSNLWSYRHAIPAASVRGLFASTLALGGAGLVLLVLGVDAVLFPRHGRGLPSALAVLAAASGVVLPLAVRPAPQLEPRPLRLATDTARPLRRVVLVGVDGLGPELLRAAVARGAPPALAGLQRRGAYGPLATLRPTEGPPLWTTVFTGRLPRHHGVKSFVTYRLRGSPSPFDLLPKWVLVGVLEKAGLVSARAVTSASRRRPALWNALNAFGIPAGVVRFWGTHPAERVQGFMLSHTFHLLDGAAQRVALHPPDLEAEVRARIVSPAEVDEVMAAEFLEPTEAPDPWARVLVEQALAPDLTYQRAGAVLRAAYDPPFFATYFYGLDVAGHAFFRFDRPQIFGDVSEEEARRYGRVRERYLAFVARFVAEQAEALRAGEVLLLVSTYGMEPVPLWRRLLGRGTRRSGTHAGAPDGILLAVGDGIRAGAVVQGASLLDLAPTILYLMGLPVARDMEGRVLAEMLEERVVRTQPLTFIPSYESLSVTPAPTPAVEPPALPEEP